MNKFLKTRKQIKKWLISMNITKFIINEDLTVDVVVSVDLQGKNLYFIPIKFNNINGYFDCSRNNLTSLEGCPKTVNSWFDCSFNKLTTLEGCPKTIEGDFICSNNNLTSLKGCPKKVGRSFYCSYNNLTSLEGCPETINCDFSCHNNKLTTLEYFPEFVEEYISIDDMSNLYEDFNNSFERNFDTIKKIQNRVLVEKERNNLEKVIQSTQKEKSKFKI